MNAGYIERWRVVTMIFMYRRRWICQDSEVFNDWVLWRLTPKPRQVWQSHRNDTSLTVHVHNIVARFWERASGDNQWICSKAQMSLGKTLITSGQSEAWMHRGESMDGIRCSQSEVSALPCKTLDVLKVHSRNPRHFCIQSSI